MPDYPNIPYYHIDHLIAEGGTARVYWGIDLRSGFPVAIKELNYVVLIERPKLRNTASILLNMADIVLVLILFIAVKPSFTISSLSCSMVMLSGEPNRKVMGWLTRS